MYCLRTRSQCGVQLKAVLNYAQNKHMDKLKDFILGFTRNFTKIRLLCNVSGFGGDSTQLMEKIPNHTTDSFKVKTE